MPRQPPVRNEPLAVLRYWRQLPFRLLFHMISGIDFAEWSYVTELDNLHKEQSAVKSLFNCTRVGPQGIMGSFNDY